MESLPQMLARNARLLPDMVFAQHGNDSITYDQLFRQARRFASFLSARGVRKGEPVGISLPNGLPLISAYWGCQVLGAVATPMSPMLRQAEVRNILGQTKMRVVFVDTGTLATIESAAVDENPVTIDVSAGSSFWIELESESDCELAEIGRGDVANVFFTSGTTGTPKGAMQTHFAQYSALRDMMVFNRWRYGREVAYCALPLTNNMACTCMMNLVMFAGGTLVVEERWETRRALDTIRTHRVTFMAGPPTVYVYLINEFDPARDDISTLRLCIAGGAPVPTEIVTRFEALSGGRVAQGYGATEVVSYVTADPLVGERRIGSAGLPIGSTTIAILDDHGQPAVAGEVGEVCIDGDTVGVGYWGDAETSSKAFTQAGWLSGDIGRLDEDGYLYIMDRKKDLIISGGFNIYPIEVENVLYAHPAVAMCAVVGLPDPIKGEIPVAVIQRKSGASTSEDEFITYCRDQVSAYKAPRRVMLVDSLPLSPIGKVLKRELRSRLAAENPIAEHQA